MPVNSVNVERDGPVALVVRNLPPLNLSTLTSTQELGSALRELADDDAVRALVVTGAGERCFGAGSDIAEFSDLRERGDVTSRKMIPETDVLALLEQMPMATVAALNGTALGGGLELALCCDFIVAEEGSRIGLPEIDLGLIPGDGGPVRVTRRIGPARAKRMMFLGEPIPAETAVEWGLVDELVPRGQAVAAATELAHRCASKPAEALAACKRAIAMATVPDPADVTRSTLPLFEQVFNSADAAEGVRAFLAKEPPRFGHSPR